MICTEKLKKRLGSELSRQIVVAIQKGDLPFAVEGLLSYYDSTYTYALGRFPREIERRTKSQLFELLGV